MGEENATLARYRARVRGWYFPKTIIAFTILYVRASVQPWDKRVQSIGDANGDLAPEGNSNAMPCGKDEMTILQAKQHPRTGRRLITTFSLTSEEVERNRVKSDLLLQFCSPPEEDSV
jgi:hypothetical protein